MSTFMPGDAARRARHISTKEKGTLCSWIKGGEVYADFLADGYASPHPVLRSDLEFLDEEVDFAGEGSAMGGKEAIDMALSILEPFAEAGQIYEDYKSEGQFTDEDFMAMCRKLKDMRIDPAKRELAQKLDEMMHQLKVGDIVICVKDWVDGEFFVRNGNVCVVRMVIAKGWYDLIGRAKRGVSVSIGTTTDDSCLVGIIPEEHFEKLTCKKKEVDVWCRKDGTEVFQE